jgi:hypothetical protein
VAESVEVTERVGLSDIVWEVVEDGEGVTDTDSVGVVVSDAVIDEVCVEVWDCVGELDPVTEGVLDGGTIV